MILFIDTETSGFPKNGVGLEDPTQARILEIACILTDDQGKVISTLDTLVQCGDIELSDKLPHDITFKDCNEEGQTNNQLSEWLSLYLRKSSIIVAHNIDFDLKMMALHVDKNFFHSHVKFCTMKATTDICKIPHARNSGYKFPKLDEAHAYFFGETKKSNHRAMGDAIMCKEIYFALQSKGSEVGGCDGRSIQKQDFLQEL